MKPDNIMMNDEVGDNVTLIDYNLAAIGCKDKRGGACDQRRDHG